MIKSSRLYALGLLCLLLALLLPGCVAPATPAAATAAPAVPAAATAAPAAATALTAAPAAAGQDTHLKMGLLPILDVIPFFIADQNGYFKEQGLQVDLIPVKSAQERDTLMQTGQIDGQLSDLISTGLFNKDTVKIKVVYKARQSYPNAPQYRILSAPNSSLRTPADLKGVPIGISQNTVIQYITERLLQAKGLAAADIKPEEVTAIPVRYEQLINGNLKAATLPDPLGQGAEAAGAHLIVDDSNYSQYSHSVLTFRVQVLKDRPDTVKKFLVAWEKAVNEMNAHPEQYQNLLIDKGRVPQAIQGTYKMPPFPVHELPTEAEVADVTQWLRDKGLVSRAIPYSDMVDASFMPK